MTRAFKPLTALAQKLERTPMRLQPAVWEALTRRVAREEQQRIARSANHVEDKPFAGWAPKALGTFRDAG